MCLLCWIFRKDLPVEIMMNGRIIMGDRVFKQDLLQKEKEGGVFIVSLLFKERVEAPQKKRMETVLGRYVGDTECFWYDEKGAGFAAKRYTAQFKEGGIAPQLMITPCDFFTGDNIDTFKRSQMWDCLEDRDRIFDECKYQIFACDMLASVLPAKERACLDMDFVEGLVELYPTCEAVYFHNSGKLFLAETIRKHQIPKEDRFIKFAVNVRFFNIEGSDDMIVDTLGMGILFLPDLQYHFHDMDPNWVVNHAYCTAAYILQNDNPIESGDPIDGIIDGQFSTKTQWKCNYETALIQPVRDVIDICMNEYAAGGREES